MVALPSWGMKSFWMLDVLRIFSSDKVLLTRATVLQPTGLAVLFGHEVVLGVQIGQFSGDLPSLIMLVVVFRRQEVESSYPSATGPSCSAATEALHLAIRSSDTQPQSLLLRSSVRKALVAFARWLEASPLPSFTPAALRLAGSRRWTWLTAGCCASDDI